MHVRGLGLAFPVLQVVAGNMYKLQIVVERLKNTTVTPSPPVASSPKPGRKASPPPKPPSPRPPPPVASPPPKPLPCPRKAKCGAASPPPASAVGSTKPPKKVGRRLAAIAFPTKSEFEVTLTLLQAPAGSTPEWAISSCTTMPLVGR